LLASKVLCRKCWNDYFLCFGNLLLFSVRFWLNESNIVTVFSESTQYKDFSWIWMFLSTFIVFYFFIKIFSLSLWIVDFWLFSLFHLLFRALIYFHFFGYCILWVFDILLLHFLSCITFSLLALIIVGKCFSALILYQNLNFHFYFEIYSDWSINWDFLGNIDSVFLFF